MAKKRKSDTTGLDEVDRTMYTTFCGAANSLSQLYTQAQNQQKLAFQAGERHGLEKLYQWILRQQEEGSRITGSDIFTYLQSELDYGGEEVSMSPAPHSQQHNTHNNFSNLNPQMPVGAFGHDLSPARSRLQPFHMAQGGYYSSNVPPGRRSGFASDSDHAAFNSSHGSQAPQNDVCSGDTLQNRGGNSFGPHDSSMDMHEEGPNHNYYQ